METLNANKINRNPFEDFKFEKDLIEWEGPVLSHYRNGDKHVLYYWVDYDDVCNRWLMLEITGEQLFDYLAGKISLYDLVHSKDNELIFTADIGLDLKRNNLQALSACLLPESYFPDKDSYFKS